MNRGKTFLAFDLGALSGRAIVGIFDGTKLVLDEIYRFPNNPVKVCGNMYWDILRLFFDIKKGLSLFVQKYGISLDGIGVDSWGGDFGLFDENDNLLANPYHYRDNRINGIDNEILNVLDAYQIYQTTGRSLTSSATLCQLYSIAKVRPRLLNIVGNMLMIPGIVNFFLTGKKADECTILNTSCFYDIRNDCFAVDFLERLGIPKKIMPQVIKPGMIIGSFLPDVAQEVGLDDVPVISVASHDTASAAVAVPAVDIQDYAFISSGTWSALGIETSAPMITEEGYCFGLVTEATAAGKFITVSEIPGMWIVNECEKAWRKQGKPLDYQEMTMLANRAQPFTAFIDPTDRTFINPSDMPRAIIEYCQNTGQKVPQDNGSVIRIILESLALKYKEMLVKIETVKGSPVEVLHLVGGGTRNKLLNQLTADATGKTVVVGPAEAATIGNIIMQAIGTGYLKSVSEARRVIRSSFQTETYYPQDTTSWENI